MRIDYERVVVYYWHPTEMFEICLNKVSVFDRRTKLCFESTAFSEYKFSILNSQSNFNEKNEFVRLQFVMIHTEYFVQC